MKKSSPNRSGRFASPRSLQLAVPTIIVAFVAGHVLIVTLARHLREHSASIQQCLARIDAASEIRGELHAMGMAIGRSLEASAGDRWDGQTFTTSRKGLETALARFRTIPPTAEDAADGATMDRALLEALRAIDLTASHIFQGDLQAARALETVPLNRRADAAINQVISDDLAASRALNARIVEIDGRVKRWSPVLDAVAAAFALLLMAIGLQANRQFARLSEERNQMAERRADELEIFAGRVAHDLKNPLGAVSLRLNLAQRRPPGDDRVAGDLASMSEGLDRTNAMIEQLLEFARAGGRREPSARASLVEAFRAAEADFAMEARSAGVKLAFVPPPPAAVACPLPLLASVLGNLIRNALKFIAQTPGPAREVTVRAGERRGRVRIEISDTGPGIAPEMQGAIFEPFVRAGDGSRPGIGLGLATVKRIIQAHGGEVGVDSQVGRGSDFWFELPRAPDPGI